MEIVNDPEKVEDVYASQYDMLAKAYASFLPSGVRIAELGAGKGQLTVPLAKLCKRCSFDLVDSFSGPYAGTLGELRRAILRARLESLVRVHSADFLDWISDEYSDKYKAVISSEFLPEIDSYEVKMFMPECYRVLRRGGLTIHSFLSSTPRNRRQKLLIEADSNPRWTKTPPKEWFSPKPTLVMKTMRRVGFRNVRLKTIKSGLVIRSRAAKELLRTWDIRRTFWEKHKSRLEKDGLEIPDWTIISGFRF